MNDYNVSQYGIFSDAVSTSNTFNTSVTTEQTTLSNCKSELSDGSVFMGPICNSCVAAFGNVDSKISTLVTSFSTMSSYLIDTSSEYKKGDSEATKIIIMENGVVTTSTLSKAVVGGTPVYYNQNGYYDENGNWCKWQSSWGKDIASSGCGPTSMAAVLATMFGDSSITPTTVANMMNYDDNIGGTYVKKAADAYGLDQTHSIGLDRDIMNNFLRNDGKMIVAVNNGGHYISVLGINDSTNPPTYIVCDPNDSNTATKTWTYNDIAAGHTMVFHIAPKGKTVEECTKGTLVQV